MINDYKSKGEWKIQLSMQIIFASFTDANETRDMYTKSDNITILSGIETDDVINELFNTFHRRYQKGLQTKMKGSSLTFERIDLSEYHLCKISLNRGSSYINSSEWIKKKKVTVNPQNTEDNNCFQYTITAALNYQNKLNLGNLLIITIGIIFVFQQGIKTILRSKKTIAILQ